MVVPAASFLVPTNQSRLGYMEGNKYYKQYYAVLGINIIFWVEFDDDNNTTEHRDEMRKAMQ